MPSGILGSLFGWKPGLVFDPSLWLRAGDGAIGLFGLAAFLPLLSWCAKGQVGLTRLFLAPSAAETELRLTEVKVAKDHAARAEASSLTRIERDLHDGPQQKLIRLGYDLAALERRLAAGQLADAQQLTAEMKVRNDDILAEIRLLSRGFAPPVLTDMGLGEAVIALAAAAPVPTTVFCDLAGERLPDPIERAVYYSISEALTNVSKHAHATAAQVRLDQADGFLTAKVIDDGVGGASVQLGHGLAGLVDRVAGVSGTLGIASEPGCGTTLTVVVPLR